MRQAGRYLPEYRKVRATTSNFLELCYSPKKAAEITLQPLRRYKMDAAIIFSDILVIPDALGQKVKFVDGVGPVLEPVSKASDLDCLSSEEIDNVLQPVLETITLVKYALNNNTTLIGFAGSPWTVAFYMVEGGSNKDGTKVKYWAKKNSYSFQKLIDILCDATIRYVLKQIESGVEVIQLFDSWAGLLNREDFKRWVIEPNRRIVKNIKFHYPNIPVIGFPRNAGKKYFDFAQQTGVDGINIDHTVSLDWAAEVLQPICTVQGNLDNSILLSGGKEMDSAVKNILDILSRGPFIFNLGHGILPATPPEHVERVVKLVNSWRG
tara:strand:+ start:1010 stop:1978 length:969 start_codon:yes stop_codon:yes gene_type:complete